jgi:hypothetical protein
MYFLFRSLCNLPFPGYTPSLLCLVLLPADPSRQVRASTRSQCGFSRSRFSTKVSVGILGLDTSSEKLQVQVDARDARKRNTSTSSAHPPNLDRASRRPLSTGSEEPCARTPSRVAGTRLARLPETGEAPIGKEEFQLIGTQ